MVNFVRRTGEPVVLRDAVDDETFGTDPRIESRRVRSLLCTPMRRDDELVGLLYFENAQLVGTFTEARLEMLEGRFDQFERVPFVCQQA